MNANPAPELRALITDLAFSYRLCGKLEWAGEETMVLLHGSGVDETTLVPLAAEIAPDAALIAVRARVPQEGGWRWFERITPTRFGQESIRAEAEAFAGFLPKLSQTHGIDLSRTTFLGYSNGANLISSVMLLHPGLIGRAVLLRAMPVLEEVPATDLSGTRILVITGAADVTYSPFAPALVELLSRHRADVTARTVAAGHEFGAEDVRIAREWLAARPPVIT
jgi:phospholipase/carboxylesterase